MYRQFTICVSGQLGGGVIGCLSRIEYSWYELGLTVVYFSVNRKVNEGVERKNANPNPTRKRPRRPTALRIRLTSKNDSIL